MNIRAMALSRLRLHTCVTASALHLVGMTFVQGYVTIRCGKLPMVALSKLSGEMILLAGGTMQAGLHGLFDQDDTGQALALRQLREWLDESLPLDRAGCMIVSRKEIPDQSDLGNATTVPLFSLT